MPPRIGRYAVQRVLARDGRFTLYVALQDQPRRQVVVKVFHGMATDAARRLRRIMERLGRLRHPAIAGILESGVDPERGEPFVASEYVPRARTILEHADERGLDLRARLRLWLQVCAALHHAHRRKVIHGGLKPGNVLIDEAGRPRITDFGMAIFLAEPGGGAAVAASPYAAPEQSASEARDLDVRCDVHALGVLLDRLIAGRASPQESKAPVDALLNVARRAAAPEPADRYASAAEVGRQAMRALRSGASNGPAAPRRRPLLVAAAVGGGILTVAAILAWYGAARRPQGPMPPEEERPLLEEAAARRRSAEGFTLQEHHGEVTALCFGPGDRLAAGAADRRLVVFGLEERRPLLSLTDGAGAVRHLAFDAAGRLACADDGGYIRVLDPADGRVLAPLRHRGAPISALAMSPSGQRLAWAGEDLALHLVRPEAGAREEGVLRSTSGTLAAVAFDRDGQRVVAGSQRDLVFVWEVAGGRLTSRLRGLQGGVIAVGFRADGGVVAVDQDGRAAIWAPSEGEHPERHFVALGQPPQAAAIDPGGRWLLVASEGAVGLWDLAAEPRQVFLVEAPLPVRSLALDAGLRWWAAGSWDGTIRVEPLGMEVERERDR